MLLALNFCTNSIFVLFKLKDNKNKAILSGLTKVPSLSILIFSDFWVTNVLEVLEPTKIYLSETQEQSCQSNTQTAS